jgi:hypothetical protein
MGTPGAFSALLTILSKKSQEESALMFMVYDFVRG